MNKYDVAAELNPPQPLRRPSPLNHFPYPTPHINTTAAKMTVYGNILMLRKNWN